ncbi:F0F1 ATP synthase subunit delta [Candidatus Nomurabacteria bacterium]|nr:F0F1 ATP synthase subunit delta [Candidatus Nomurabacteria bacterium]
MKEHYASAVVELLQAGTKPADVFRGLDQTLAAHSHSKLKSAILRSVERKMSRLQSHAKTTVTVVSEEAAKKQKAEITKALTLLEAEPEYELSIDEAVIGGLLVESAHRRLDTTYRSALVKLYRNITK